MQSELVVSVDTAVTVNKCYGNHCQFEECHAGEQNVITEHLNATKTETKIFRRFYLDAIFMLNILISNYPHHTAPKARETNTKASVNTSSISSANELAILLPNTTKKKSLTFSSYLPLAARNSGQEH